MEPEQNYLPEEEITPPKTFNFDESQKKKLFFYAQILLLILLLFLIAYYAYFFFININQNQIINPMVTPTIISPTPTLKLSNSRWATDSAVLLELKNLDNLENVIKTYDLAEPDLSFPALDFHLNFDKNE